MTDKGIVRVVFIVAFAAVAIFLSKGYFGLERESVIQDKVTERVQLVEQEATERALKVEDKTTERVQVIQEEKTERTEERSKFWNKLVPWGPTDPAVFNSNEVTE